MPPDAPGDERRAKTLTELAGRRALNLYQARRLCCSEAVLLTLNHGFGGGLGEKEALALASGFCGGIGEAGCVCGGLSGAVAGLGLFLAPHLPRGLDKKTFRAVCKEMHGRFVRLRGTACCRDICRPFGRDRKARLANCGSLTREAAAIATGLLLAHRPDLALKADVNFLDQRETRLASLLGKVSG
jgi:C_GCAxxG_C_C family probable redox protein